MSKKTAKNVKDEVLTIINGYIKGFAEVEPDSKYFNGYRAALNTVKENIEEIEVKEENDNKDKKGKIQIL